MLEEQNDKDILDVSIDDEVKKSQIIAENEPASLDMPNESTSDIPEPNCLALTVRKDYNLTIIKNIFTTSGRMSLKIALSTFVLNFLRMFL